MMPTSSHPTISFSPQAVQRVLFCKVDLDTCLAALILGVPPFDERLVQVRGAASPAELKDSRVLCLECGGTGQTLRGNFDHHNTSLMLPPACRQAFNYTGMTDAVMARLVDYVCGVDVGPYPAVASPTLANLFSGMLLVETDPWSSFSRGVELLRTVYAQALNPFETLPVYDHWTPWLEAKQANRAGLAHDVHQARIHTAASGLRVGFLSTPHIGGTGALYTQNCQVVVLHNPAYGNPPMVKYTIGGKDQRVNHLLGTLNALEPNWGGQACIIGSPFSGSRLTPEVVLGVVLQYV